MKEETLKAIDRAFKALEEREELLDKIKADIEDLDIYYDNDRWSSNNEKMYIASEVLAVIDKYKEQKQCLS